jgi:hypothetical protein
MGKAILCVAAVLMAAVAGCTSVNCNCPASGCDNCSSSSSASAAIYTLSDAVSVSSIAADSPCSATFDPPLDRVLVSRLGPGTCTARITYSSGVTDVFHVQFTPVSGGCGCYLAANTSLEPMDAGDQSSP